MEIQVIEKTNGRINRVTGTTIKERLRVCAYCRVSTDNEERLNSYQSQLKYYDEKIISKDLFDRVQEIRTKRAGNRENGTEINCKDKFTNVSDKQAIKITDASDKQHIWSM